MGYLVSLTARAERDFLALFEEVHAGSSTAAMKWYRGMKNAILKLEEMPARCPFAAEGRNLRNLLYGRKPHVYRVIFRILEEESRVEILHIRHGARLPAKL